MKQVSMKLYPQLRHEILNEDCREDIFRDILCWLTEHLPA
jgi:alpha-beta hydrolase superfamily lysophospholipase